MYEIGYYDDKQANKIIGLTQLRSEDRIYGVGTICHKVKHKHGYKVESSFSVPFCPKNSHLGSKSFVAEIAALHHTHLFLARTITPSPAGVSHHIMSM